MITSFPQYLLMAPSYISVLNVYAVRPISLIPLILSHSTGHSSRMCTMCPGERRATIRSLRISVSSSSRRTPRKSRCRYRQIRRISMRRMRMRFMCCRRSDRRRMISRMWGRYRRIIIGRLGRSEWFLLVTGCLGKGADGWPV